MCDFSLHAVRSRPAKVGDKLTTRMFNLGTRGFSAPEDERMAVCLLPGTELSFANDVRREIKWPWTERVIGFKTAIFRQINLHNRATHHDALEFPNGEVRRPHSRFADDSFARGGKLKAYRCDGTYQRWLLANNIGLLP